MEVAAEASQNVGECERTAWRDEEKQCDENFASPEQRQHFAVELHEPFGGQPPVRARSGHDEEDSRGKENDCAEKSGRDLYEWVSHELTRYPGPK